jgi:hypothetical protein
MNDLHVVGGWNLCGGHINRCFPIILYDRIIQIKAQACAFAAADHKCRVRRLGWVPVVPCTITHGNRRAQLAQKVPEPRVKTV